MRFLRCVKWCLLRRDDLPGLGGLLDDFDYRGVSRAPLVMGGALDLRVVVHAGCHVHVRLRSSYVFSCQRSASTFLVRFLGSLVRSAIYCLRVGQFVLFGDREHRDFHLAASRQMGDQCSDRRLGAMGEEGAARVVIDGPFAI